MLLWDHIASLPSSLCIAVLVLNQQSLYIICVKICLYFYDCLIEYQMDMGYGYGIYRHFQEYFSYTVAVGFIDGGNR